MNVKRWWFHRPQKHDHEVRIWKLTYKQTGRRESQKSSRIERMKTSIQKGGRGFHQQPHLEWIGLSPLLSAALWGGGLLFLRLRLAPFLPSYHTIRLDALAGAPLSFSLAHIPYPLLLRASTSLHTRPLTSPISSSPSTLVSQHHCLEAMAMAVGSSCRATVGSLPVAQVVSVRASSPRSTVSLSSAFVGLHLQGRISSSLRFLFCFLLFVLGFASYGSWGPRSDALQLRRMAWKRIFLRVVLDMIMENVGVFSVFIPSFLGSRGSPCWGSSSEISGIVFG